ncbi:MAG: TetR/AcrR family transcriptional regulator [Alphaproteobacteria bacterium]|nr:TetR/AcrR family transcriptional regulator [Alphaproteobacteria bacterium]
MTALQRPGRPRDPEIDDRIVDAARALLHEGGLDTLSMAAVAERAGVGKATVYRRYADARALAGAVLFDDLQALAEAVPTALDPHRSVLDQLVDTSRPFLTYFGTSAGWTRAMLQLALFQVDAEAPMSVQGMWWVATIAERLEAAKAHGLLLPDVNTMLLANAWFSLYVTTLIAGAGGLIPDVEDQVATLHALLAQHLRGLVPDDAPG